MVSYLNLFAVPGTEGKVLILIVVDNGLVQYTLADMAKEIES